MADKSAEQIKYKTELLRLTWFTIVAAIGGSLSVLLGGISPVRIVLATAGFLVTLVLLVAGWRLDNQIRAEIEQIKEDL